MRKNPQLGSDNMDGGMRHISFPVYHMYHASKWRCLKSILQIFFCQGGLIELERYLACGIIYVVRYQRSCSRPLTHTLPDKHRFPTALPLYFPPRKKYNTPKTPSRFPTPLAPNGKGTGGRGLGVKATGKSTKALSPSNLFPEDVGLQSTRLWTRDR